MYLNVFYRISDNSYDKPKLPGATKKICLQTVKSLHPDHITIIADNCSSDTMQMIRSLNYKYIIETSLSNAGSFRHAMNMACSLNDEDIVYMAEDDYLYKDMNCKTLIEEGLSRADYITLYDHPDKYESEYNYGEICKVFKTPHSHWRQTISTTMTFATKVKTLKDDLPIWEKHTEGLHPWDHLIFNEITLKKKKMLAVSIPGAACHIDLTYSAEKKQVLIDNWAIEMMTKIIEESIIDINPHLKDLEPSIQKLIMLSQIAKNQS